MQERSARRTAVVVALLIAAFAITWLVLTSHWGGTPVASRGAALGDADPSPVSEGEHPRSEVARCGEPLKEQSTAAGVQKFSLEWLSAAPPLRERVHALAVSRDSQEALELEFDADFAYVMVPARDGVFDLQGTSSVVFPGAIIICSSGVLAVFSPFASGQGILPAVAMATVSILPSATYPALVGKQVQVHCAFMIEVGGVARVVSNLSRTVRTQVGEPVRTVLPQLRNSIAVWCDSTRVYKLSDSLNGAPPREGDLVRIELAPGFLVKLQVQDSVGGVWEQGLRMAAEIQSKRAGREVAPEHVPLGVNVVSQEPSKDHAVGVYHVGRPERILQAGTVFVCEFVLPKVTDGAALLCTVVAMESSRRPLAEGRTVVRASDFLAEVVAVPISYTWGGVIKVRNVDDRPVPDYRMRLRLIQRFEDSTQAKGLMSMETVSDAQGEVAVRGLMGKAGVYLEISGQSATLPLVEGRPAAKIEVAYDESGQPFEIVLRLGIEASCTLILVLDGASADTSGHIPYVIVPHQGNGHKQSDFSASPLRVDNRIYTHIQRAGRYTLLLGGALGLHSHTIDFDPSASSEAVIKVGPIHEFAVVLPAKFEGARLLPPDLDEQTAWALGQMPIHEFRQFFPRCLPFKGTEYRLRASGTLPAVAALPHICLGAKGLFKVTSITQEKDGTRIVEQAEQKYASSFQCLLDPSISMDGASYHVGVSPFFQKQGNAVWVLSGLGANFKYQTSATFESVPLGVYAFVLTSTSATTEGKARSLSARWSALVQVVEGKCAVVTMGK
ncbi:MAG: hypothetical protein DPW14_10135 [Planctomycetes bacterium]|nr:hypothetical protein [Planctomycetota bacterium]